MTELEDAWGALLAATPTGWYVGQPSYHDEREEWLPYALSRATVPWSASGAGSGRRCLDPGRRRPGDGTVLAGDQRGADAAVGKPRDLTRSRHTRR
jgi:hypothetical protein